jgi:hypothetical protein
LAGFHSVERHPSAKTFPGLAIFRFSAPLTLFNADISSAALWLRPMPRDLSCNGFYRRNSD